MTAVEPLQLGAERAPFVMTPCWLLYSEISDGAKVLYGILHDLVAGREGPTRPVTRGQLAGCCRVSVDTVDRRLAELIKAGAVDKQAQFDTGQGQLANVYWVRLSPPAAAVRPPGDTRETPGRTGAVPPDVALRPAGTQPCGDPGRVVAAPKKEQVQEVPPQPPRSAGGPTRSLRAIRRRAGGTTLRAVGANPRARTDQALADQQAAVAARRAADLEAQAAARRAGEAAARVEAERFDAEALALSAVLDDDLLAAVVDLAAAGLAGPLARSPLAVTRAVVAWCRTAAANQPGSLSAALAAALTAGMPSPADGEPPPLVLAAAPPGTAELRHRIAGLLHREAAATGS